MNNSSCGVRDSFRLLFWTVAERLLTLLLSLFSSSQPLPKQGGDGSIMGKLNEEQTNAVSVVVDLASDIRALFGAISLRAQKQKLGEVEELAQEQDTKALLALEDDLDDYCDALEETDGYPWDFITGILEDILPDERYKQFQVRKNKREAVPA